jgi:hypothetical protein
MSWKSVTDGQRDRQALCVEPPVGNARNNPCFLAGNSPSGRSQSSVTCVYFAVCTAASWCTASVPLLVEVASFGPVQRQDVWVYELRMGRLKCEQCALVRYEIDAYRSYRKHNTTCVTFLPSLSHSLGTALRSSFRHKTLPVFWAQLAYLVSLFTVPVGVGQAAQCLPLSAPIL